jgi:hypothetical protein
METQVERKIKTKNFRVKQTYVITNNDFVKNKLTAKFFIYKVLKIINRYKVILRCLKVADLIFETKIFNR